MPRFLLGFFLLIFCAENSFAYCTGRGDCCRCPGQAQDLGSHATCEEACGLTSASSGTSGYSPGTAIGTIIGTELGKEINKFLWGDPEATARQKAEQKAEATVLIEVQRRSQEERSRMEEEKKQRLVEGMMGVEDTPKLGLMVDGANPELALMSGKNPEAGNCGGSTYNVSMALHAFHNQAEINGYSFLAKDVGNEVFTKENLKKMGAEEYLAVHDKTKNTISHLQDFSEELRRITTCLNSKNCDLIELNKKINAELGSWLKGHLKQGTKKAIDRVSDARTFLTDYVKRIQTFNEKAMKETACR